MDNYQWKDKKILFYGAGTIASHLFLTLGHVMEDQFIGFIDLRGAQLKEKHGFPVFSLEQCGDISSKENYVIVITTRNVFEHSKIADLFLNQGFYHIIFKPLPLLKGESDAVLEKISIAHDSIHIANRVPSGEIPPYQKKSLPKLQDFAIIEKTDETITAYLPSSLLFTNGAHKNYPKMAVNHCHFASCYLAVDLYRSLEAGCMENQKEIDLYLEEIARLGAELMGTDTQGTWADILLESRLDVYHQMNQALALDFQFFLRNTSKVSYNQKGQLSLIASGKNRVSFLIAKGYEFIPIRISHEDYDYFLNPQQLERVTTFFTKEEITEVFAPIPHSYFYKFPCVAANYNSIFLHRLSHSLGRFVLKNTGFYDFSTLSVLSCLEDAGAATRYFHNLSCAVSCLHKNPLQECLDDLCYSSCDIWTEGTKFSVLLLSNLQNEEEIETLLAYAPSFVFVLQWSDKKQCSISKMYEEEELFRTYWNGISVRGVLYQHPSNKSQQ